MAVRLEKIVKKYYEGLDEGKILARKCRRCGGIEWPPVLACNSCGCTDMEWIEVSGKAKMHSLIMPQVLALKPDTLDLMPFALAIVQLDEGGEGVNSLVLGVSKKNRPELLKKMPVPVKAKIIQREGYKTIVFELEEEDK